MILRSMMAAALAAALPALAAAPVERGKVGDTIRVLVAAEEESVLAAQMAGRIRQVNAQFGAQIRAGQPLLQFDCDEQDARLKMAKAELYGAQQNYESKAKLQAMESVSQLEVEQAASAVEKFRAQVQLYQAQLRQCSVSAPFSGRVTKLRVKAHESVTVGQPLIEVVNDRRLKAQLNVPSTWLAQIKANTPFTVRIEETGNTYEARVRRVNGKVDAVSQSVEIEGEFRGNPADLLPGMSGIATFSDAAKR
ncbi:MAG: efflux transporter periplasmic adaptor subunit [Rhodocyclaceae bacterium]|nr:efflux transporter periplasmic adaptor subunit [Rhodocyclaceae bacterium]